MHIVIDISEDAYKIICEGVEAAIKLDYSIPNIFEAVRNGAPLPKGHGRLITEPTKEEIEKTVGGISDFAEYGRDCVKTFFDNAETIIEADTESGGEE